MKQTYPRGERAQLFSAPKKYQFECPTSKKGRKTTTAVEPSPSGEASRKEPSSYLSPKSLPCTSPKNPPSVHLH